MPIISSIVGYNQVIDADSGFTAGAFRISRNGKLVSIAVESTLSFAEASSVSTSVGFLPNWARPKTVLTNIFDSDASLIKRARIDSNGEIELSFRDYTGAATGDTGVGSFVISYPVE